MKAHFGNFSQSALALLVGLSLPCLPACSGSSGGSSGIPAAIEEDETVANDTPATANRVSVGTPVTGEVNVAGDIDVFKMDLAAGRIVQFELFGTRGDQETWDTELNVPRLTLLDTDANLNAKLLEHDYSGNFSDGWSWGFHDLDIPMFKVPATGTYYVAVTQDDDTAAGGSYTLRAHYLSVAGLQQEAEAVGISGVNDDAASAQPINPGTMHGYHVADELDYYSFTISGPTIVRFELTAYRNGVHDDSGFYYDTYLYLYDTDGTTQLVENDDAFFYDAAIQYRFDAPGTYFVAVDQYDTAEGDYFLAFTRASGSAADESEPNDDTATADTISYAGRRSGSVDVGDPDYYKFTGAAGDMVRLQYFDGDNGQNKAGDVNVSLLGPDGITLLSTGGDGEFQTLTTILQESGTHYVLVEDNGALGEYVIELTRFKAAPAESEPNDTDPTADVLSTTVSGVIDPNGDVDVYRVSLSAGRLARVSCYSGSANTSSDGASEYSDHGSSMTPLMEIYDSVGVLVSSVTGDPPNGVSTESVTDPLPVCTLSGVVDVGGTYYIHVSNATAGSGSSYYYVLELRRE